MKRSSFYISIATLLLSVLSTGCNNDSIEEFGHAEPAQPVGDAIFTYDIAPMKTYGEENTRGNDDGAEDMIDVRMVDDMPETRADETAINDMWILQFNDDGSKLLMKPYYTTNVTVPAPVVKNINCRIYFIANTGNSTLFNNVKTADDVINAQKYLGGDISKVTANGLPMCGYYSGYVLSDVSLSITLHYTVAKVDFKIYGESDNMVIFAELSGVPAYTKYWYSESDMTNPPTTSKSVTIMNYNINWGDTRHENATNTIESSIYVPANMQGIFSDIILPQSKIKDKAPNGMCINFYFYCYDTIDIENLTPSTRILYRKMCSGCVMLGCNSISDYNILPNGSYSYDIKIRNNDPSKNFNDFRFQEVKPSTYGVGTDFKECTDNASYCFVYPYAEDILAASAFVYDGKWQNCRDYCNGLVSKWKYKAGMWNPSLGYSSIIPRVARWNSAWFSSVTKGGYNLHVWYPDSSADNSWKYKNFNADTNLSSVTYKESSGAEARTLCIFTPTISLQSN